MKNFPGKSQSSGVCLRTHCDGTFCIAQALSLANKKCSPARLNVLGAETHGLKFVEVMTHFNLGNVLSSTNQVYEPARSSRGASITRRILKA